MKTRGSSRARPRAASRPPTDRLRPDEVGDLLQRLVNRVAHHRGATLAVMQEAGARACPRFCS